MQGHAQNRVAMLDVIQEMDFHNIHLSHTANTKEEELSNNSSEKRQQATECIRPRSYLPQKVVATNTYYFCADYILDALLQK